ncbi:Pleckstriny domain containing protein [Cryptosporidium felis]|nr:Pleckstriny domain containing protein [Cryptosporidium felis]
MDMEIEDDLERPRTEISEQTKLLEQKVLRLEKLVKSRDEALNELYELEKTKNEEITTLKERIKQDGIEASKLQNTINSLNEEILSLNEKVSELEQQNINNLRQQIKDTSSPCIVEDLLTDKESLYKEIADLRLQISQLEAQLQDKDEEFSLLQTTISDLKTNNEEIQLQMNKNEDSEKLAIEREKAHKQMFETKISALESDLDLFKSDCSELLNLLALIQMNPQEGKINVSSSIQEAKKVIVNSIMLSDKCNELVNNHSGSDDVLNDELLSFSQLLVDQIIKSSPGTNIGLQGNFEDKIDQNYFCILQNWIGSQFSFFIDKSPPLSPIIHTESIYKEREFILKQVETEFGSIETFLNKVVVKSENPVDSRYPNLFQIFTDLLYIDFLNKGTVIMSADPKSTSGISLSERESDFYLKVELLFKLTINSVVNNNPEPLIVSINKIISINNSEVSKLHKIELEDVKNCQEKCFDIKKFVNSLLKLTFGYGWTFLHIFSHLEQVEVLQLFLDNFSFEEQISFVNRSSYSGFVPITLSILKNNILLTELFLTSGSDVQIQDNRRNTLIHLTTSQNIQEILIKRRVPLTLKNSSGQLPSIIGSKSQVIKFDLDNFDQNDSENDIDSKHKPSNDYFGSEFNNGDPSKLARSFSCQIGVDLDNEEKVILSTWISGNEPISTCRDDFCVFSTPEFETCNSTVNESFVWNFLGFSSNRNISTIYKGKNGDHAAIEQNLDRLEEMNLSSAEKKGKIWSDFVINYTARGLEKSCFPPPLDCPTNLFRQILVLTSERFALFQYSPLKLLQAAPIMDIEEVIIPKNSHVLLLLKIDGWDDILLEVNHRSEFLDELTTLYRTITTPPEILLSHVTEIPSSNLGNKSEKSSSFWLGFMNNKSNTSNQSDGSSGKKLEFLSPERASAFDNLISVYGENPPIITEPDNLIGLFNSQNQYSLVLAIINRFSFMLLPHRETSLLVSVPTYHFGFLGICVNPPLALENPLSPKKKASSDSLSANKNEKSENRLWQERFFILRSDGALIWCHHPNDAVCCETIPIRFVRQIRVFNLATSNENEVMPCFALDFTKNSIPSSLILHSDSSETRDKWVEKIHNVRTILSESAKS